MGLRAQGPPHEHWHEEPSRCDAGEHEARAGRKRRRVKVVENRNDHAEQWHEADHEARGQKADPTELRTGPQQFHEIPSGVLRGRSIALCLCRWTGEKKHGEGNGQQAVREDSHARVGGVNEYSAERRTEHRPDAGGDVPASHRHRERCLRKVGVGHEGRHDRRYAEEHPENGGGQPHHQQALAGDDLHNADDGPRDGNTDLCCREHSQSSPAMRDPSNVRRGERCEHQQDGEVDAGLHSAAAVGGVGGGRRGAELTDQGAGNCQTADDQISRRHRDGQSLPHNADYGPRTGGAVVGGRAILDGPLTGGLSVRDPSSKELSRGGARVPQVGDVTIART